MGVRDQIKELRDEIENAAELQPDRAAEIRVMLSALQANVLDEYRKREMIYNRKLLEIRAKHKSVSDAVMEAETTPEYESMLETRDYEKAVKGMMSSLRLFLKAKEDEFRQTL